MKSIYKICFSFFLLLFNQSVTAQVINIAGDDEYYDQLGEAVAAGDFNCDGYDDLAIGVPGEDSGRGAINIVYGGVGSGNKLGSAGNALFKHDEFWNTDDFAEFGAALATGDFDGDNCDDLAIGAPWENVNGDLSAGAVIVAYGDSGGIDPGNPNNTEIWHQDSEDVAGGAEEFDYFGASLAAGDFNNDGYDDLAIGVPHEDIDSKENAGAIHVLYGAPFAGLQAAGSQLFHQDTDVSGVAQEFDYFGYSLAAGNFDGDSYDDLAIGVPFEDYNGQPDSGVVNVLYGSINRLSTSRQQFWHQDSEGIKDTTQENDKFGFPLAAGDFDSDGYDDLAIGVTGEHVGEYEDAGAVAVLYSDSSGLTDRDQFWHQANVVYFPANDFADFGYSLAAGDFNGDGHEDLAIGAPGSDHSGSFEAGVVNILYGGGSLHSLPYSSPTSPVVALARQLIHQDKPSILDEVNSVDWFGASLAAGDFNNDGVADLVIGVPSEDNYVFGNSVEAAGVVQVLYGDSKAFDQPDNQLFVQ